MLANARVGTGTMKALNSMGTFLTIPYAERDVENLIALAWLTQPV